MKNKFNYILLFLLGISFMSCEKDNYEPPKSPLTGRVIYQGTPLYLQPNRVSYELFQDGFGKSGPISGTFTADGNYSQLLFNGTYKMIIREGQGPFLWGESVDNLKSEEIIHVNGATEMDIEVLPYWMIINPNISFSEGKVTGTFGLEQIIDGANAKSIESVTLYLSKTVFANSDTNVATNSIGGSDISDFSNINLSVNVPTLTPSQNYIFASIGVKIVGVEDMIFSEVQKINL
ncbi:MAG: DUF3823 domain-containing protein [Anditalea sp.]